MFDPNVYSYTATASAVQGEVTVGGMPMADSSVATITKVAAASRRKELRRRYRALLATGTSTSFSIAFGANTFMTEVRLG